MESSGTMTDNMILAEVASDALERARRLEFAIRLIQQGECRRRVSGQVYARFGVSRPTAWRIVDIAWDMAGVQK